MMDFHVVCLLLGFSLVYDDIVHSKTLFYFTPSLNDPCPHNSSCLTITQLADNSTNIFNDENNVSLYFLAGNHTLDCELSLTGGNRLSITKYTQRNGDVTIHCSRYSGRFVINNTVSASIEGLHFFGCGDNIVDRVKEFTMLDTTFDGSGSVLIINEVTSAKIVSSSFLHNTPSAKFSGTLQTTLSSVAVISSKFMYNQGGVIFGQNVQLYINGSIFCYNNDGVLFTSESIVSVDNSTFCNNSKTYGSGGIMKSCNDSITVNDSTFSNNNAREVGGVIDASNNSTCTITNSNFINNIAEIGGGVIAIHGKSSFFIFGSTFKNNRASYGGVFVTYAISKVTVSSSIFAIMNSSFMNNWVIFEGGVVATFGKSFFYITNSIFTDNRASRYNGGAIRTSAFWYDHSSFNLSNCIFKRNSAANGGALKISTGSSFYVTSTTFTSNSATNVGAAIWCWRGSLTIEKSIHNFNKAENYGIIFTNNCSTQISNSKFQHNIGSVYVFNDNLSFNGHIKFENSVDSTMVGNATATQGGAITSFQSSVKFQGQNSFLNNQARFGGSILAIESIITILDGETRLKNNMATNGGGISLQHSSFEIKGNCYISNNSAARGGGIHASASTVVVHQPGTLRIQQNIAKNGGGMYLEVDPKVYVLKSKPPNFFGVVEELLILSDNHASYGGAVYVADDTNSGACLVGFECFMQVLGLHEATHVFLNTKNIAFSGNTATKQGSELFGGVLDRCIISPFAELHQLRNKRTYYSGSMYLEDISNIILDSISSHPVQICFCSYTGQPDCSYQHPPIRVKKGEIFTVPLVAVDQVNHTIAADVISFLDSSSGGFGEGQQKQNTGRNCTYITFSVFSPMLYERISLYADGPCGSATLSTRHVDIQFVDCTCPIGFKPLSTNRSATRCECTCDPKLFPYITSCNSTINSLLRMNTNSWIAYVNDTDFPGYVIHPNCPVDYCQPPTRKVYINLNIPSGADAQCAYNHSGVLCGACQHNLSLSLGSSHCLQCDNHWPTVFVVIILASVIAGVLLVTALLFLNMTVAVGLINGFIFYANIVAVNRTVFFPSSEPSFPTVFVAWLNFDIGIDVCFFSGLDAYAKTWLQLPFPLYIIFLVTVVIVISRHSSRFVRLIGRRDPIATLATLILLSYAKLLSITIAALSPAILQYPDGRQEVVWLQDGNVKYLKGKHIPLFLVALLVLIIGLPYTIILFLWQWLVCAPNWKTFKWIRSTKLNSIIAVYHAPYNSKYRYWTGLLLLVRVVLYITSSAFMSAKPQTLPLMTIISVGGLIILSKSAGSKVYRSSLVEVVDMILYLNLLAFAAFTLYDFKINITKQAAVAYTSTTTTIILLICVIVYHIMLLTKCRCRRDEASRSADQDYNKYILAPTKPAKAEIGQSVVEFDKCHCSETETSNTIPKIIEASTLLYQ